MLGRKLYKTKLCILYQRGHCARQSCSFAHGEAELRRFGGPATGRRDYRGDLRDKLDRRYSPRRRFSPGHDGRGRNMFYSRKTAPHDRGHSASRSPVMRSKGSRKRQESDGQSDASRSPKTSLSEERVKERKGSSYGEIDAVEEQLKQTQLDIDMFDDHKSQLEVFLEEKVHEADKLSSRIEDLEAQLSKEQEDYKRFSSKIKKLIKAHSRFVRAKEDLKRSQSRLLKVCGQLDPDNSRPGNNEEDSSLHVISDGEHSGDDRTSPKNDTYNHTSPMKKKLRLEGNTAEEIKPGSLRNRERILGIPTRQDKISRAEAPAVNFENELKEIEIPDVRKAKTDTQRHLHDEHKHKDSKSSPVATLAKVRVSDSSHLLPSTSMAAHAVDEFIEAMETEEKSDAGEAAATFENGDVGRKAGLPILPMLPQNVMRNNYQQYECDDEEVDVEDLGADAEGSSEVEIEQV